MTEARLLNSFLYVPPLQIKATSLGLEAIALRLEAIAVR